MTPYCHCTYPFHYCMRESPFSNWHDILYTTAGVRYMLTQCQWCFHCPTVYQFSFILSESMPLYHSSSDLI